MIGHIKNAWAMSLLLIVAGCVYLPSGPSVLVLPSPGKPFDVFQAEDRMCQQWAMQQTGVSPQETANNTTAASAVTGAVIGAGLGAAIGAASGDAGAGAAIGGGTGLLVGTANGAGAAQYYGAEAQRRYDHAYIQCMYSYGNQVPMAVRGGHRIMGPAYPPPPPPPGSYYGPPPYGPPPPSRMPPPGS